MARDHFDREVEASLRRDLPIVTTSHAKSKLTSKGADSFTNIYDVDPFHQIMINLANTTEAGPNPPSLRVTGMPGKHVPLGKPMEKLNEIVGAVWLSLFVHFLSLWVVLIRTVPSHQRLDARARLLAERGRLHRGLSNLYLG